MPPFAYVRIFTMIGELVFRGSADAAGTLLWDGRNNGRKVGSGTYYAVIQSDGARVVRRLVIVR